MGKKLFQISCYFFAMGLLTISMWGCKASTKKVRLETTTIPLTIRKPAEIDLKAQNIDKLAVADFKGKDDVGIKAAEMLAQALEETMVFTVMTPNKVDRELLVNGLGIKSYMEKSTLKKMGEALKVDAFFLGEVKNREIVDEIYNRVISEKEETGEFEFVTGKDGKLEYVPILKEVNIEMECKTRVGKVTIQYTLYNATTGNPMLNKTETLTEEVDAFCYRTNLNPEDMPKEAVDSLLDEVMLELNRRFVDKLTPPSKTELIVFEKIPQADEFSRNLFEIGINYAKFGEWQAAIENFERCQNRNNASSQAHYNLGIAYKGNGFLAKALSEFKKANSLEPKKLYKEAIHSTKQSIKESRKVFE